MNRKIGVFLLVFIGYLIWLYLAIYESSTDQWWTVNEIKQADGDTIQIGISYAKVLVGTAVFTLSGFIVYFLLRKRS